MPDTPHDQHDHHDSADPEALPPLTPAAFHILLTLGMGERHGYAIMQEVKRLSDGRVRLGPGTLYRVLKELLDAGLIAESGARPDPAHDDERRRYYRLTDLGQRIAQAETRRLARLVSYAQTMPGWQPYSQSGWQSGGQLAPQEGSEL